LRHSQLSIDAAVPAPALIVQPSREAIRYVEAEDGHPLALHYYAAADGFPKRAPVLLVHGLGANRHNFDLFGDPQALPRQLARLGYDAYILELRGVGLSRAPRGVKQTFGVDLHLRYDLPAAVDYVLRTHQADKLHWVGHSLGAILGYVYGGAFPERLASMTAVAGPVPRAVPLPGVQILLPLRHLLRRAPLQEIPNRLGLMALKRVPKLARAAYDGVLFCSENLPDDWLIKVAEQALENVPISVLHRLGEWVSERGPYAHEVERSLGSLFVPTLLVAATRDPLCPPHVIEHASRLMPAGYSRTRIVSRDHGFQADYGHGDLLVSPGAKREVFPLLLDFIQEQPS